MPKPNLLSADYVFQSDRVTRLNLREINELFGDWDAKQPITRYTERRKEPLWEGYFGMFDGPSVVPTARKTVSLRTTTGLSATNHHKTTWFGLTESKREASLSAHNMSGVGKYTLGGADLTALCAYTEKLDPSNHSPIITTPYEGAVPYHDQNTERGSFLSSPFGIDRASMMFRPEGKSYDTGSPFDALLFMGAVSISTNVNVERLPENVAIQGEVLAELTGHDRSTELYGLFGVSGQEHLDEVWQAAMGERTAKMAALSVRESLG